jgi:hypothetical protein
MKLFAVGFEKEKPITGVWSAKPESRSNNVPSIFHPHLLTPCLQERMRARRVKYSSYNLSTLWSQYGCAAIRAKSKLAERYARSMVHPNPQGEEPWCPSWIFLLLQIKHFILKGRKFSLFKKDRSRWTKERETWVQWNQCIDCKELILCLISNYTGNKIWSLSISLCSPLIWCAKPD